MDRSPNKRTRSGAFAELAFEPALETEFRRFYAARNRQVLRIALIFALLLELGLFVLDSGTVSTELVAGAGIVRLLLISPVICIAIFSTYPGALARFESELALSAGMAICGGALLFIGLRAASGLGPDPLEAAVVVALVNLMLGLRFQFAAVLTVLPLLASIAADGFFATSGPGFAHSTLSLAIVAAVALAGCFRLERYARTEFLYRRAASDLAGTDASTDLPNRKIFMAHLQSVVRQARREAHGLAVALARIDRLEAYEERYGTEAADSCLRRVAHAIMRAARRPLDYAARYSPTRFGVVFYDPDERHLAETASRIRGQVAMLDIPNESTPDSKRITVSIGVATSPRGRSHSARGLLKQAAKALEQATELGSDKLVIQEVPEPRSRAQILMGPWKASDGA